MGSCASRCSACVPPVYFQKWVAIDNKRLWVMYFLIYSTILALVVAAIVLFHMYAKAVQPRFRLALWGDSTSVTNSLSCSTVADLSSLDYDPTNRSANWIFQGATCANRCSNGLATSPNSVCFSDSELVRPEGDDALFFATIFNEEVSLRYHGSYTWMSKNFNRWFVGRDPVMNATLNNISDMIGSDATALGILATAAGASYQEVIDNYTYVGSPCPFPVDTSTESSARRCMGKKSYVVPDLFEDLSAKFAIEYQVRIPDSVANGISGQNYLKTIVKSSSGKIVKTVDSGKVVTLSVKEAMDAAGLSFDAPVKDEEADVPMDYFQGGRPLGQAVGMDIALHVEVTNTHPDSGADGAPVCEITVKGKPAFMVRKDVVNLDTHGSVRVRTYSGVRFTFSTRGTFSWFQLDLFIYLFTLCVAWLQLPGMFFFAFAVRFLGTLSEAYSGYSYEHVDMSKEVNGVSARALSYSFSQEDVSDLNEEGTLGISHEQTRKRLLQLLEGHKTLGLQERQLLTEFFYDNTSSEMPSGKEAIRFEEQLHALMSNENLRGFQDVVGTIDPDGSNKNALEYVFTDDTVKALSAPRKTSSAKSSDSVVPHDTNVQIMNRLTLNSSLWVVQRCNLMRARLGQVALRDQINKLHKAGEGLAGFATKLESRF